MGGGCREQHNGKSTCTTFSSTGMVTPEQLMSVPASPARAELGCRSSNCRTDLLHVMLQPPNRWKVLKELGPGSDRLGGNF